MADQKKAIEGIIRMGRTLLEELAEAGFFLDKSEKALQEQMTESIRKLEFSDRARTVRAMSDQEIEALVIDYELFEIYAEMGRKMYEDGHQRYSDVPGGLLVKAIEFVSDAILCVLTNSAKDEMSGEPKLYFAEEDGDLVWVEDPNLDVQKNAGNLGIQLPGGMPGDGGQPAAGGDLASLLQNLLGGGAGAVVIAGLGRAPGMEGAPQEEPQPGRGRKSKKNNFPTSKDGKVVYMTPPTDTKQ